MSESSFCVYSALPAADASNLLCPVLSAPLFIADAAAHCAVGTFASQTDGRRQLLLAIAIEPRLSTNLTSAPALA